IPSSADEEAMVLLSDILPTGFECGVINGQIKPGSTVAIVGSGPIGLATLLTAQLFSPSQIIMIDIDDNRLVNALNLGATAAINSKNEKVTDVIMKLTAGKGVDTAIEAVGIPSTFELCTEIVTAGGVVANVGVHGKCVDLHLETLWSKNITITTRLVDTVTTPTLQKMVLTNKLKPKSLITHHFSLDDVENAYQTFANAAAKKVLKVILTNHSIDDATSV
ncbi:MAG: alcohol dehydrogenase, partial [Sphingobacteriales bacterium]